MAKSSVIILEAKDKVSKKLEGIKKVSTDTIKEIIQTQDRLKVSNEKLQASTEKITLLSEKLAQSKIKLNSVKNTASKTEIADLKTIIRLNQTKLTQAKLEQNALKTNISQLNLKERTLHGTNINYENQIRNLKRESEELEKQLSLIKKKYGINLDTRKKALALTQEGRATAELKNKINQLTKAYIKGALSQKEYLYIKKQIIAEEKRANLLRENTINNLVRHIRRLESLIVASYLVANAYRKTIGLGVKYNKTIENNSYGLAALIASNTNLVNSQNKVLSSGKKFQASLGLAKETLLKLKDASLKTSASFPGLTEVFQQAIGFSLSLGKSFANSIQKAINRTIDLTTALTNMGGSFGMNSEKVLEETRSLFSGDISTDSKLGILLFGSPREANQALREAKKNMDGVYNLLKDKLEDFKNLESLDTLQRSIDTARNKWTSFMGSMAEPINEDYKDTMKQISKLIDKNSERWSENFKTIYKDAKSLVPVVSTLIKTFIAWKTTLLLGGVLSAFRRNIFATTVSIKKLNYSLIVASRRLGKVKTGLVLTKRAFKRFLPAAIVLGVYELGSAFLSSSEDSDTLRESLKKTRKELEKMSIPSLNQRLDGKNGLRATKLINENSLKEIEKEIKKLDKLYSKRNSAFKKRDGTRTRNYKETARYVDLVADKEKAEKILSKTLEQIERTEKALKDANERQKKYNKNKVSLESKVKTGEIELNSISKSLDSKIDLEKLSDIQRQKKEIIKESQKEIEKAIKNTAGLQVILQKVKNNQKLNEVELSSYKAYQDAKVKATKLAELRISKLTQKTKKDKDSILEDKLSKQLHYYETIGDYAKAWSIKEQELRRKYGKAYGSNIDKFIQVEKEKYKKSHTGLKESLRTSLEDWSEYYKSVGDLETSWALEYGKLNVKYVNLNKEQFDKIIAIKKEAFTDSFVENSIEFKGLEESKNSYISMLDSQQKLIESTNTWSNSLSGNFKKIGTLSTALTKLSADEISSKKSLKILDTKYQQDKLKLQKKGLSTTQLEKTYAKDLAKIKQIDQKNQIDGYSQIAGAMGTLFKQGSDGANAMMLIQNGLATVNAVNAVLSQASGDPYTAFARMAVMAGTVAGLLQNIGQSFGFNNEKTSKDSFATLKENEGKGSVLGDANAKSESINKSLDILKSFAKPQFNTLQEMNKYLASIDEKMGGVASLIYRNEDFAQGKNFKESVKDPGNKVTNFYDKTVGKTIDKTIGKLDFLTAGIDKMANGIVAKVVSGIVGRKIKTLDDAGIYIKEQKLKDAITNLQGQSYQVIKTTKDSWFRKSSKLDSYFKNLDEQTNKQFELILKNLYKTVLTASNPLSENQDTVKNSLDNFKVKIGEISLKDKTGKEVQEQFNAVFSKVADDLSSKAYPKMKEFQDVGEGLFQTLTRVTTGVEQAKYYINSLGKDFKKINYLDINNKTGDVGFNALLQSITKTENATYPLNNNLLQLVTNLDGTAKELYDTYLSLDSLRDKLAFLKLDTQGLSSSMIAGAGSLDNLANAFNSYFTNFLSKEEQYAHNLTSLTKEFARINLTLPKTKEAFKDLLNSFNLATKKGQEQYGKIISLNEKFSSLISLKEDLEKQKQEKWQQEQEKRRKKLFEEEKKRVELLIKSWGEANNYLKQTYNTSKSTINSILKNNTKYQTEQYKKYISEARKYNNLVKLDPYNKETNKKLYESVKNASSYTQAYLNKDNYNSELDYRFAQLSSANTFKEFQNSTSIYSKMDELLTEIKELKNTAKTQQDIAEISAMLERRTADILEEIHNQNLSNNALIGESA